MKIRKIFHYLWKKDSLHPPMTAISILFVLSMASLGKSSLHILGQ